MNKIQNMIKHIGVICFTAGLITACSEYGANRLNMRRNRNRARTDGDREPESIQPCNDCRSLYMAARNGHGPCVNAYIEAGTDVNTRYGIREEHTVLMVAAEYGHEACVKTLIDAGADVNARYGEEENGHSVLMVAAKYGHEPCVNALIEAGADISYCDRGLYTALTVAAMRGHEACVSKLIDAWVNIRHFYFNRGGFNNALIYAARHGHTSCVKMMIDAGAEVNARGNIALILAAKYGYESCVKELLEDGADVNARDYDGNTALMWATRNRHGACIRLLTRSSPLGYPSSI